MRSPWTTWPHHMAFLGVDGRRTPPAPPTPPHPPPLSSPAAAAAGRTTTERRLARAAAPRTGLVALAVPNEGACAMWHGQLTDGWIELVHVAGRGTGGQPWRRRRGWRARSPRWPWPPRWWPWASTPAASGCPTQRTRWTAWAPSTTRRGRRPSSCARRARVSRATRRRRPAATAAPPANSPFTRCVPRPPLPRPQPCAALGALCP